MDGLRHAPIPAIGEPVSAPRGCLSVLLFTDWQPGAQDRNSLVGRYPVTPDGGSCVVVSAGNTAAQVDVTEAASHVEIAGHVQDLVAGVAGGAGCAVEARCAGLVARPKIAGDVAAVVSVVHQYAPMGPIKLVAAVVAQ